MERAEWLKKMRSMAEELYDHFSPLYWVDWGVSIEETHQEFLQKFLELVGKPGVILSAGCGAGLNDGILLEAGHSVVGIDQSEGMLKRARQHYPTERFPQLRYEKMGMQEMTFHEEFDGVTCIDALEHNFPEDYPLILRGFSQALKPGGVLYFTVDDSASEELEAAYQKAKAMGLPVVYGELVDRVEESYAKVIHMQQLPPGDLADSAVYHFYPSLDQVRQWLDQAGMAIVAEGSGKWYHHFLTKKW